MNERGRILIADDEETFLHSTMDLLREQGYGCRGVSDAPSALSILSAEEYDLLVCDINMPGNYRLEFLAQVTEESPELPVIVITGYPSVGTAVESFRLSAVDYLQKPLDFQQLETLVGQAVKRAQFMRTVRKTREEVTALVETMDSLEQMEKFQGRGKNLSVSSGVHAYFDQTVSYLATVSSGLKSVFDVIKSGKGQVQEELEKTLCPKCHTFREGLHDTINVLNKTKTAFKSKDLGELRGRTEILLNKF